VSRARLGRLALGLGVVALGTLSPSVPAAGAPGAPIRTTTPIRHFVSVMQEGHSFDNYFGTYPGADGIPKGACMPSPAAPGPAKCVAPFSIGKRPSQNLSHTKAAFDGQFHGGAMDGFVTAFAGGGVTTDLAMGHYDRRDIPYYWNLADRYVLFDRFFGAATGGTVWNHMFWVSATPGNPQRESIPPNGFGDVPTIFDQLEKSGISWKFYVQNYDPKSTFRAKTTDRRSSQLARVPLVDLARFVDDPKLFGHIVSLDDYYTDLEKDSLPAVSYIVPSGSSEHPPGPVRAGERMVRSLINALQRSSAWRSSALLLTYDSWGGWFDHVPPPRADAYGPGFRVPALLVSAYARRGAVISTPLDTTSVLKFVEDNWGLAPLAARDAHVASLLSAFDFGQPPRAPAFVPAEQHGVREVAPARGVIYLAYGAVLLVATGLIATAARLSLRGRLDPGVPS